MKKILGLLVVLSVLVSPLYAQETNNLQGATQKAVHGITNIFTGWIEIPAQAIKGSENGLGKEGDNKSLAGALGILKGIIHAIGRTTVGVLQFTTALLPNHKDNEGVGIPLDSEYAWQEKVQSSAVSDGVGPVEKKIERGLFDAVGGVLEFPAQLHKTIKQNSFGGFLSGICKAIVYPIARVISGLYDLSTAVLPNDIKTYGHAFEETRPLENLAKPAIDELGSLPVGIEEPIEPQVMDIYSMQLFAP